MRVVRCPGGSTVDKGTGKESRGFGPKVSSNADVAGHWFCCGVRRGCDFLRQALRNAPGTNGESWRARVKGWQAA
jgi:hypothetical protein